MAKAPTLPDDNEPITARQLIELAKIETSARDDAVQRIPTATDTTPPNSVLLAKEIITNRIEARHRALLNGISHIQQLIDAIPDPRLDRNIATLAGQVEAAVMLPFQDSEPMTRKAVGEERDARSLYKSWRDARGLHGVAPIYPLSRINHFATVAVSAVVEAVLTGTMYMNATPDGLSGAITIALGVTGINSDLGIIGGLFATRYLANSSWPLRVLARITLVAAPLAIVALNFTAAHYREAAVAAGDAFVESMAAQHILQSPFELSLPSIALLMAGLGNAGFAWWKGYKATDPVPGFETQDRRYQEKLDALDDLKATIHGKLDAILATELVYARDRPQQYAHELQSIRHEYKNLCQLKAKHTELDTSDIAALEAAIKKYRTINETVRSDNVVPVFTVNTAELRKPDTPIEDLAINIEAAVESHVEHTQEWLAVVDRLTRLIQDAKDMTTKIMDDIERAAGTTNVVPQLADLRDRFTNVNVNANDAAKGTAKDNTNGTTNITKETSHAQSTSAHTEPVA